MNIEELRKECEALRQAQGKPCEECKGTGKITSEITGDEIIACPYCKEGVKIPFWPKVIVGTQVEQSLHMASGFSAKRGDWVAVRPCGLKEDKT